MKIILIAGKAGSGKTSLAKNLKLQLSSAVVTNFSKYIKLFAQEMLDWDGNDDTKPRTFLQEMGDKLRAIDKNFLTKRILEDIKIYEQYYKYVIISDVRLVNEILFFQSQKDYPVITIRVNSKNFKRKLSEKEKNHPTEIELDNYQGYDYIIENDNQKENNIIINKIVEEIK